MSISIDTLRAVHHPVRRRIIDYLLVNGASQVGALARDLSQQVGSISHHLRMLERVEVVARAPELATDGRTSWWRLARTNFQWAVDDFSHSPADQMQAQAAERLNAEHHWRRLGAWQRSSSRAGERWRRAAFSTDNLAVATPEELARLQDAITDAMQNWRDSIDLDDGNERHPVFVFAHGFPSRP